MSDLRAAADALLPLPPQPEGVPFPEPGHDGWAVAAQPQPAVTALVDEMLDDEERYVDTYAIVVVQGGRVLAERYGGALPSFTHEPTPVTATTPLLSWSMAKSALHLAVGVLVDEGRLDPDAPAPVPAWRVEPDDARAAITLDHLLAMRDGLRWAEDYVDAGGSDVIEMLFASGAADHAAYAESRPLAHEPGSTFNYSSGTSNVVAAIVGRELGGRDAVDAFLHERLFDAVGMTSADARFDDAGTFVGSSYVHATARDYARLGLLALRGGRWDGRQLVPAAWIDHGRRPRSIDPEEGRWYGSHWWVDEGDVARGTWRAAGYEGQTITMCPALDAVVVRLGRTPKGRDEHLTPWRHRVLDALPEL
ncbi:MAG: serine hydrolase [Acidimicrobiia bacterium]|nr:serine hydrolase [Acidimicrobiia bacterium]